MKLNQNENFQKSLARIYSNTTPLIFAGIFMLAGLIEIRFLPSNIGILASYIVGIGNLLGFIFSGSYAIYGFALMLFGYGIGMLFHNYWNKGKKSRVILIGLLISNSLCWALVILPMLNFSDA